VQGFFLHKPSSKAVEPRHPQAAVRTA
jgi:hypothetical protein